MTVYGRKQATFLDYEGFVAKFKPLKTTDDCLTPSGAYEAVRAWAVNEYAIGDRPIVRPFWPGGDYEMFDYPDGCVVLDNPPFSMLSKIVRWFHANRLDYFLFAPHLTAFNVARDCPVNYLMTAATITYENGASINTSFVTNLGPWRIFNAPTLARAIAAASDAKPPAPNLLVCAWPDTLIRTTTLDRLTAAGIEFAVRPNECAPIGNLDALRQQKRSIFGSGFLISQLRAEQLRAEQLRAAKEKIPIVLSTAEQAVVDSLAPANPTTDARA